MISGVRQLFLKMNAFLFRVFQGGLEYGELKRGREETREGKGENKKERERKKHNISETVTGAHKLYMPVHGNGNLMQLLLTVLEQLIPYHEYMWYWTQHRHPNSAHTHTHTHTHTCDLRLLMVLSLLELWKRRLSFCSSSSETASLRRTNSALCSSDVCSSSSFSLTWHFSSEWRPSTSA